MPSARLSAKSRIEQLIRYFEQNIRQLMSASFNETQARQQLIDPFFEALGWDVTNRGMKPLYLQEVVPEGRVKTTSEVHEPPSLFESKQTLGKEYKEYASILDYIAEDNYKASAKEAIKKPDYRFRIKGQTKFFVEAKKPFVDLAKSQEAIFQVKRYGFSGRVPVSILTDFEEFRVFDCTHKPLFEKPKLGVIKNLDLTFEHYLDQFDLLYDTFAREAVESGSLDSLTKSLMKKRTGDFALDKAFLEDLSQWRVELARDIAKHPKNRRLLTDLTLNESVQRILDRIVFFRVCEDREIEVENTLLALVRLWKERPGASLYGLLTDLFKKRRELYNGLLFSPHECEQLEVSDKIILTILENLNYPFSPYHFNEIGVEILGSIYEKFLGKTIHLDKAKKVHVSEKPEVRKAGGVYYTPQYIVEYIVNNTVGKLIEGKTPTQIAKLKVIDIACGSGSFLLGAFQKLIDYHIEWYTKNPNTIKTVNNIPDAFKDANGDMRLSSRKKRDILVNNIYGVDIDRQAVEVTQMSLYLKVLEGENSETLNPQMTLALKEVYLPSLADNIKCGNSLIGTDFASQDDMFENASAQKINAFDWETEFAVIMRGGGFDCVIGNPPYLFITELEDYQKEYFFKKYKTSEYRFDVYGLFTEIAITRLLKKEGYLSFIIPHTLLSNDSFEKLRRLILNETRLDIVTDIGPGVFQGAKNETMIFVLRNGGVRSNADSTQVAVTSAKTFPQAAKSFSAQQKSWLENHGASWLVNVSRIESAIVNKIEQNSKPLGKFCTINQGLRTGDNEKFLSSIQKSGKWKRAVGGKEVGRYEPLPSNLFVYYVPEILDAPRRQEIFESKDKLVVQEIRNITLPRRLIATYDSDQFYCLQSTNVINLRKEASSISTKFLLGVLNSNAANFFFRQCFSGNNHIASNQLAKIPIPNSEEILQDELTALVEKMLDLNKQLQKANFDSEREPIERQIAATDRKIDQLVYQLYDLTAEEIRIVEGQK